MNFSKTLKNKISDKKSYVKGKNRQLFLKARCSQPLLALGGPNFPLSRPFDVFCTKKGKRKRRDRKSLIFGREDFQRTLKSEKDLPIQI